MTSAKPLAPRPLMPGLVVLLSMVAFFAMSEGGLAQTATTTSAGKQGGSKEVDWLTQAAQVSRGELKSPTAASQPAYHDKSDDSAIETNSGEDFTRPVNRFDARYKYEQTSGSVDAHTWTLRTDSRFDLPSGWQLSTRVDLPTVRNNATTGNPDGDYDAGLGNVLTQALLITPHVNRMAAGGGMRVTWPTATQPQLGNEKYVLGPMVGGAYYPEFLPEGSLIGGLVRYEFSAGGGSGSPIERLIIQPLVNVNLPKEWFVNFQPELAVNFRQDSRWFIPFNVTVGKKITKNIVTSVEWKQGLLKDYHQYDWSLEFRIGFFF